MPPGNRATPQNPSAGSATLTARGRAAGSTSITPIGGDAFKAATADRLEFSLSTENALYAKTNPPFIYPGPGIVQSVLGSTATIKRGYIRRLTEYYKRLNGNQTQKDSGSTLQNMRCNFQFNPDNITRSISANQDLQYFFNQEVNQLAQPIPGEAGFAFELLFNREAELNSGKYIGPDGNKTTAKDSRNRLQENPAFYINNVYDPAWVTEIGVLADTMIFDDIVGQGLARDVLENLGSGTQTINTGNSTSNNKDEGDKNDSEQTSTWNADRLKSFSANLGNKAFLTPMPVRIMFSPWFMVEGFVMNYTVTFNKFTPTMIPSQAIVAVQMQALYIGFAQNKTFLTDIPAGGGGEGSGSTGSPDVPAPGTPERVTYDQTKDGLNDYIDKAGHLQGSSETLSIHDCFFANPELEKEINFIARVSPRGRDFYKNTFAKELNGGGITFTVSGEIKVYWDSYVSNASNSRTQTRTNASYSGSIQYTKGAPPTVSGVDYAALYGTKAKPFIAKLENMDVYYDQGIRYGKDNKDTNLGIPFGELLKRGNGILGYFADKYLFDDAKNQLMILGQVRYGQDLRVLDGGENWIYLNAGKKAIWKWDLKKNVPIPFNQDKFTVELDLVITARRSDQDLYTMQMPQRIKGSWTLTANEEKLFEDIAPSPGYKSASGYSSAQAVRRDGGM